VPLVDDDASLFEREAAERFLDIFLHLSLVYNVRSARRYAGRPTLKSLYRGLDSSLLVKYDEVGRGIDASVQLCAEARAYSLQNETSDAAMALCNTTPFHQAAINSLESTAQCLLAHV
jgi:hypothetical protein